MPTLIIDCPSCSRKLRVPEHLMSQQVKCPTCGHTFMASGVFTQAPSSIADPINQPVPGSEPPRQPELPGMQLPPSEQVPPSREGSARPEFVACPSCGQKVAADAVRCDACGEYLDGGEDSEPGSRPSMARRRDTEPHRGSLVLTLGILGIVFAFCCGLGTVMGIAAWVMGQSDLKKIRAGMMDSEGEGNTQAGWICGIIGTILGLLVLLIVVLYFAFVFTMVNQIQRNIQKSGAIQVKPGPVVPAPVPAPAPPVNKGARPPLKGLQPPLKGPRPPLQEEPQKGAGWKILLPRGLVVWDIRSVLTRAVGECWG